MTEPQPYRVVDASNHGWLISAGRYYRSTHFNPGFI